MDQWLNQIIHGNALEVLRQLPDESVNCVVTSPPYWGLRDYEVEGQLGLEKSPEEYILKIVELFHEVRRVLRDDGTLWLNLGDTYAGNRSYQVPDTKHCDVGNFRGMTVSRRRDDAPCPRSDILVSGLMPKNLIGIPWRIAFALQADSWYLRSDIIWNKPNCMPESCKDRPTKAHEYIFLLSKSKKYYYDFEAIKEPGKEESGPSVAGWNTGTGPHDAVDWATAGKWSKQDPQAASHRLADNVKRARARGGYHDNPFGPTRNKRTVWTIPTYPFSAAHFATFPPELARTCILAGCPEGGIVLDPFMGAGTTGMVATMLGRHYIGIELNPEYIRMAEDRIRQATRQDKLFYG